MHLLFVCTGNICRSPTAERLAVMNASRLQRHDLWYSSAGLRAVRGHPIHEKAAKVLHEHGATSSNFVARQFTLEVASASDLIITMTRDHRDKVLEIAPRYMRRTFTLAEVERLVTMFDARTVADLANLRPHLAGANLVDVVDPIGQSEEVFAAVADQISQLLVAVGQLSPSRQI